MPPSSRPRIVHVYKDVYPPVQGGIERTIHLLAKLTANGFDNHVVVASQSRKGSQRIVDGAFSVTEVASFGRAFSAPLAPGFVKALKSSGADLFHFHVPHPTGEAAFLLSGLKTPAVATYHSDVVRQAWAMGIYGPVFRRFLRRMHTVMPTSRRYLETSPWLAEVRERCEVVPLGLPLEEYAATPPIAARAEALREEHGDFVFFLGCLRAYKGLPYLIQAMAQLPGAKLLIAGEGAQAEELRALASRLDLNQRIVFTGRVDQSEAVALLHAAAVFVLPSHLRSEAFGLAQIEAMACGTPVISTDLPTGVPEVNAHGTAGLVVPPGDPAALAEAIRQLLADPARRAALGAAGQARAAEKFTASRMAKNVEEIYGQALGRR